MLIFRGERYRIYPSADQVARLDAWQNALRFLWNLAHEQRLAMLARCRVDRKIITAFGQCKELTQLRADLPWLTDVPYDVCAAVLMELDKAWQRCVGRNGYRPQFKSKARRDATPMIEPCLSGCHPSEKPL